MRVVQTYQGYFEEDGRFISDGLLEKLPTRRRAIVNILDDETIEIKTSKEDTLRQIFAEAEKAESNLSDDDWAEFENLRSQTGFDRVIDL